MTYPRGSPEGALYEICLGRFREEFSVKFRESLISAHHNYLIDRMLTPGFVLGEPDVKDDFWLLADVLLPDEKAPFLSGRFYDQEGRFLVDLRGDKAVQNPGGCLLQVSGDGFQLLYPSGEVLLAVRTEVFANGYLTRIQGKLYDRKGLLRMEPSFESARVFGEAWRGLEVPVRAPKGGASSI
jgi:hypothetical protein